MIGLLTKIPGVAGLVGKVAGLTGLQKYLLAGTGVFILSLGGFAYWQYNVAQAAKIDAAEAALAAASAEQTIDELKRQRDEDIAELARLQENLRDTRDALRTAQQGLDDLRGDDIEEFIKSDPDAAARTINERADRLFRELACETGSRADCADTAAGPDAPVSPDD